jgi:hypothetical protein
VRKGFCLLGLLLYVAFAQAQIVLPTFGVRGNVSDQVLSAFMAQLKQAMQDLGLTVIDSVLITSALSGSLDPTVAYLAAEYEGARYAILGEIQENQKAYTVSLLVGDGQEKQTSDIFSESLDPAQMAQTTTALAESVRNFVEKVVPLEGSAELFVTSKPSGATLFIDGVEKGFTGEIIQLQPGLHTLEVRLEGYKPFQQTVELIEGSGMVMIPVNLEPAAGGSLQIQSEPSAEVFVDNVSRGFTPLTVSVLPGTHLVRLQRPGFIPLESERLVKDNRVTRVKDVILTPQFDRMVYWDAQRAPLLMLDGVVQTISYAELSPGSHTVEVRRDGKKITFDFVMPEKGVFALDFENLILVPHPGE